MTFVNKGLLQINISVLLLGGTALFAKLISLPAESITFYRSIFGGLALLSLMIVNDNRKLTTCDHRKLTTLNL